MFNDDVYPIASHLKSAELHNFRDQEGIVHQGMHAPHVQTAESACDRWLTWDPCPEDQRWMLSSIHVVPTEEAITCMSCLACSK